MTTQTYAVKRTVFDTKNLIVMALLCALSIVLVYLIHLPIIPAAPFLEYDPADIPILIGTFIFGPAVGLLLTLVVSVIQGLTVSAASGVIGIIMHFVATGCFVIVAGLIYHKKKTLGRAIVATILGIIVMTAAMVGMNLFLTPIFMGQPMETVIAMLIPAIVPFNLIKAGLNGVIALLVFKTISGIVMPKIASHKNSHSQNTQ